MLGKMIIGLTAVAIVTVAPAVSASAKQKPTQQKKITVNIPKQVCETLTVDTLRIGASKPCACAALLVGLVAKP